MNIIILDIDSAVAESTRVPKQCLMPPSKSESHSQLLIDKGVAAQIQLIDESQSAMIQTSVIVLLTQYSNPDYLVGCMQYTLEKRVIPYYLRPIECGKCGNNEALIGIKQYQIEGNAHPLWTVYIHAESSEQYDNWKDNLPEKDEMVDFLVKKSYKLGYRNISFNYSNPYLHTPVIKLLDTQDIINILKDSFGMKTIDRELAIATAKQSGIPVIRFSPVIKKPLLTTPNGNNFDLLKILFRSNNPTNHAVIRKVNLLVHRFTLKI